MYLYLIYVHSLLVIGVIDLWIFKAVEFTGRSRKPKKRTPQSHGNVAGLPKNILI